MILQAKWPNVGERLILQKKPNQEARVVVVIQSPNCGQLVVMYRVVCENDLHGKSQWVSENTLRCVPLFVVFRLAVFDIPLSSPSPLYTHHSTILERLKQQQQQEALYNIHHTYIYSKYTTGGCVNRN